MYLERTRRVTRKPGLIYLSSELLNSWRLLMVASRCKPSPKAAGSSGEIQYIQLTRQK